LEGNEMGLGSVVQGLRSLLRKQAVEKEMDDELRAFVADSTAEKLSRGMAPDEASRAARVEMGSTNAVKHHIRSTAWESTFEIFLRGLWYGVRSLARSPGFTAVTILTFALGIGANAAIFQLLDAVRLRNLPVSDPAELTLLRLADDTGKRGNQGTYFSSLNNPLWEYIRDHQQIFSQVMAWSPTGLGLTEGEHQRVVPSLWVSGEFFHGLGVRPVLGRVFSSADDQSGCGASGAVVSYGFWQSYLKGDPHVIGHTLPIGRHAVPIVGVTAKGFTGPEIGNSFDIAVPICSQSAYWTDGNMLDSSTNWWLGVMGRLKTGESLVTANAALQSFSPGAFAASLRKDYPTDNIRDYLRFRLRAEPASGGISLLREKYQSPLWMLLGLAGFVLLIACANLANLMLARGSARVREFALRLSLGATQGRLIWQLVWESLVIVFCGALSGLVLANATSKVLIGYLSTQGQSWFLDLHPDWRLLAFTALLATITVLLFGLFPALKTTRLAPIEAMKNGSPRSGSREGDRLRQGLVVAQVALSLVLVTGAVLFSRTLDNLRHVDAGFRQDHTLITQLDLSRVAPERRLAARREILDNVRNLSGVQSASEVDVVPFSGSSWTNLIWGAGETRTSGFSPYFNEVGNDYFRTIATPLVAGRDFGDQDNANSPKVAIVNQQFAVRFGKGANPVGQVIRREARAHEPETSFEIVGVVKNSKYKDLREDSQPIVYLPVAQTPTPESYNQLMIHTALPMADFMGTLRRTVDAISPGIGVDLQVFHTEIEQSLLPDKLMATLSGFFGLLAALLTAVGLFGMISFLVARRTHEIGVRMALGARRGHVLGSVLRETLTLTSVGIALGLPLVFGVTRVIASKLFGIKPNDPQSLLLAALALCAVSVAAAYIPARRAASVDPMVALREE
jgi:putative ABC transport system permease protein